MENNITPLKIAWANNALLKDIAEFLQISEVHRGNWQDTLLHAMRNIYHHDTAFYVIYCTPYVKELTKFNANNIEYFLIPKRKYAFRDEFSHEVSNLEDILREIQPDIFHIHGTEGFYGLVSLKWEGKTLITLQGIREQIYRSFFSDISKWNYIKWHLTTRKFKRLINLRLIKKMTEIELKVLNNNKYFIGRTDFDKYHSTLRHKDAVYFGNCHDILRGEFYLTDWDISTSEPHTIHVTLSEATYKGIFLLIDAIEVLKYHYPMVKLNVAGPMNGVIGKRVKKEISKRGLEKYISFLGRCNSGQIISSMKQARVFVLASFIENSSVSLQEAQCMGVPCVASYTGGIPSMAVDEHTALFFPIGDPQYLAGTVARIFEDDELAKNLSENGRRMCRERNDPEQIALRHKEIYDFIIQLEAKSLVS